MLYKYILRRGVRGVFIFFEIEELTDFVLIDYDILINEDVFLRVDKLILNPRRQILIS